MAERAAVKFEHCLVFLLAEAIDEGYDDSEESILKEKGFSFYGQLIQIYFR